MCAVKVIVVFFVSAYMAAKKADMEFKPFHYTSAFNHYAISELKQR